MTHVVVLGAGIVGLSCAWKLLQQTDANVTIIAEKFNSDTLSAGAPGIWSPFSAEPKDKILKWSKDTYVQLQALIAENQAEKDEWPVDMAKLYSVSYEEDSKTHGNSIYFKDIVDGFTFENVSLVVPPKPGLPVAKGAISYLVPLIQTGKFMDKLTTLLQTGFTKGNSTRKASFIKARLSSLTDVNSFIPSNPHMIVNCLGLGAREVFKDKNMYPIRGVLVRYNRADSLGLPVNLVYDSAHPEGLAYVALRQDKYVLGGTYDERNESTIVTQEEVDGIVARNIQLLPQLSVVPRKLEVESVWVGHRPARKNGINLSLEYLKINNNVVGVVHCYGHGGSGWTTCFGCADEVVSIVKQKLGINPSNNYSKL